MNNRAPCPVCKLRNSYSRSKSIKSELRRCRRLDGVPSSELSLSDTAVAVADLTMPGRELLSSRVVPVPGVVPVEEGDPEKDWLDRIDELEPPSKKVICD